MKTSGKKMIDKIVLACLSAVLVISCRSGKTENAADPRTEGLVDSVYVGNQIQHVQGIALDREKGYMYMSFTSRFVKTDLTGKIVASIDRIQGHLGAMTFDPVNRKVYASLECKNDEIGKGIAKKLNVNVSDESCFYVAIIDVDKLMEIGADPEDGVALKTVFLKEPYEDYKATVKVDGEELKHRFCCSGIDGITIAPAVGTKEKDLKKAGKLCLYVAYGVYGDVNRKDNDYQAVLCYDLKSLADNAENMRFGTMHKSGPKKPMSKYFIFTGNTEYGVQNLAYDSHTGNIFMAVYKGKKPEYPNYKMYAFNVGQKPFRQKLEGVPYAGKVRQLKIADIGLEDAATGLRGWNFNWGATGMFSIGDGLWYFSENTSDKLVKTYGCMARLYEWTGNPENPFVPVK